MSEGFYDELGQLIDKHRGADAQRAKEQADNERFDRLESGLTRLADSVEKLVKPAPDVPPSERVPAGDPPPSPDPPQEDPPAPDPPELPVERVTKLSVPKVWNGDDEPSEMSYVDPESGETRKRPGRKKGHPYGYNVETVEPEPPGEEGE